MSDLHHPQSTSRSANASSDNEQVSGGESSPENDSPQSVVGTALKTVQHRLGFASGDHELASPRVDSGEPTDALTDALTDDPNDVEHQVEWIGVQVRWIGLVLGFLVVNFFSPELGVDENLRISGNTSRVELISETVSQSARQTTLNQLLALGTGIVLVSTYFTMIGRPILRNLPLVALIFEAAFVTLLCYFDRGLASPFRFYYFVSVILFALRFSPLQAWGAYAITTGCYVGLIYLDRLFVDPRDWTLPPFERLKQAIATVVFLLFATYVASSVRTLLSRASLQLARANGELRHLNDELEDRIDERTAELKESQALLVQREKQSAFGLLAAGIAHEVGNPLAGISSVTQMLGRHLIKQGKQDDYSIEKLSVVDQQLRRIQRTLRELTDFSRPANPQRSLTDLTGVCDAALQIAKYYARRKNKTIEEDYSPTTPPVRTVRDELIQVVLNLVLNALDATEEGGTIVVRLSREEDLAVVRIEDDGCGVLPEKQADLFEPYFTTKSHGTGLGLFVCRRIVEQSLFGTIELESSRPGRTVFRVTLPIDQKDAPQDSTLNITMLEVPRKRTDELPS